MKYREEINETNLYKENYVKGFENLIKMRQTEAEAARDEYTKDIFTNPEKYRDDLKKMLGWPLVQHSDSQIPEPKSELLSKEDGYEIFRMQFEILDGLVMTGLFFRQDGEDEKPLVILQHGKLGTPELISGIYGSTTNYNDMLQRVRKHGVHVFAPQLLLWDDKYNVEFNRELIDGQLKRVGSSITAIEVFGIIKILDYFEQQKYVSTFGMVGLSYGGFYTLYTSAIDTRIKSAISCAYFNKRDVVPGFADWSWLKSAEKFDDAEVACLVYPRNLCIEIADNDPLFDHRFGIKSFEKIQKMSKDCETDWIELKVFEGIHEFCHDDEPIIKLINHIKM